MSFSLSLSKINKHTPGWVFKKMKWYPGHRDGVGFIHIYVYTGVCLPRPQTTVNKEASLAVRQQGSYCLWGPQKWFPDRRALSLLCLCPSGSLMKPTDCFEGYCLKVNTRKYIRLQSKSMYWNIYQNIFENYSYLDGQLHHISICGKGNSDCTWSSGGLMSGSKNCCTFKHNSNWNEILRYLQAF